MSSPLSDLGSFYADRIARAAARAEAIYDRAGNVCCGQDFMAGTLCSLAPEHEGPHAAGCQVCDGDWINQTCTCVGYCEECGAMFDPDPERRLCLDCRPKSLDELVSEKVLEIDTLDQVAQQLGQALGRAIKRNVDSPYEVEVALDLARDWYVITVTKRGWFTGLGAKTETVILPSEALALHTGSKETFRYWTKRAGPMLRALFEGRDRFVGGGWYEATGAGVTVSAEEKSEVFAGLAELGFDTQDQAEEQWAIETLRRSLDARPDSSPSPGSA